jgi:hypothetical protein
VVIAGRAQLALPRTYVFDAQGQPLAAFGRFIGARTLNAIDEAVRRAVVALSYSAAPLTRASSGHGSTVTRRMWRRWP